MKMYPIRVKALWFQPEIGLEGYYGAVLMDGTPVALCSAEKWNLGPRDSLRRGWTGNIKRFPGGKKFQFSYSETELRQDDLGRGKLRLTVPPGLSVDLQPGQMLVAKFDGEIWLCEPGFDNDENSVGCVRPIKADHPAAMNFGCTHAQDGHFTVTPCHEIRRIR